MSRLRAKLLSAIFLAIFFPSTQILAQDEQQSNPLAIHMNQWLVGSREWTTPNPDHNPEDENSFAEFRVYWDWGPFNEQLLGKLFGVTDDGRTALFWNMYTTFNPATRTVIFQQVGWGGAYIQGEHPVREEPLAFGEVERLDTGMYAPDGTSKQTRHENVFYDDGSHQANVFEQDENGDWKQTNTWTWKLVSEEQVLGTSI
ncbi:MAG TPA: hypothetical protein VJ984_07160 [Xanthomonadales bacterium]|nr:hypothetical protein [Xanthomonadales bacterium]